MEFLKVINILFLFAVSSNPLNPKAEVFEKFMHLHIPFQNKYAPPVCSGEPLKKAFEGFQVNEA